MRKVCAIILPQVQVEISILKPKSLIFMMFWGDPGPPIILLMLESANNVVGLGRVMGKRLGRLVKFCVEFYVDIDVNINIISM